VPTVKRNNFATLNLSESLDNFKETVTKVLELSEVENWDGKTFLQKEQKIREAAGEHPNLAKRPGRGKIIREHFSRIICDYTFDGHY